MISAGEVMTDLDWKKKIQEYRDRQATLPGISSRTHADVEFEIIRDENGRDIAFPKKSFMKRRQDQWDRMRRIHPGMPSMIGVALFNGFQKKTYDELCTGLKNAILFGSAGTGKTQVAMSALHSLCIGARSVVGLRFADIKRKMEPRQLDADDTTVSAVLREYSEPEFLLLDELGYGQEERKAIGEHERQVLFELISEREAFDKKIWLTTNMSLTMLEDVYGDATISRLAKWDGCVKANFSQQPNFRYQRIK